MHLFSHFHFYQESSIQSFFFLRHHATQLHVMSKLVKWKLSPSLKFLNFRINSRSRSEVNLSPKVKLTLLSFLLDNVDSSFTCLSPLPLLRSYSLGYHSRTCSSAHMKPGVPPSMELSCCFRFVTYAGVMQRQLSTATKLLEQLQTRANIILLWSYFKSGSGYQPQ